MRLAVVVMLGACRGEPSSPPGPAQLAEVSALIEAQMELGHLPGVAVALVSRDEVAWTEGFGTSDLATGAPVTADTSFMLASVSKTAVGAAVMQGRDEGWFTLDEPTPIGFDLRNPSFPDDPIPLRQLLTHTSSLADRWSVWRDLYVPGDSDIGMSEFVRGYFEPGGEWYDPDNFYVFAPGEQYRYANMGVTAAASALEVTAGEDFAAWCDDRLFAPLGMDHTAWHLQQLDETEVAASYEWRNGDYVDFGRYGYPDYPDGGLRSSANDLATWMRMWLGGGEVDGVRVLAADTVAEMLTPQLTDVVDDQGLVLYSWDWHGCAVWAHEGSDSGVSTGMYLCPDRDLGLAVLTNGGWGDPEAFYAIAELLWAIAE